MRISTVTQCPHWTLYSDTVATATRASTWQVLLPPDCCARYCFQFISHLARLDGDPCFPDVETEGQRGDNLSKITWLLRYGHVRLPDFKAHVPFFQRLALNLEILSHALQSLLIGYGI